MSGKEQLVLSLTQTQDKDRNGNKDKNSKGESHLFHFGKQDHWTVVYYDLEEEQQIQLQDNLLE